MTMSYIRNTYRVPCKRGNLIRAWYKHEGVFRMASDFARITSASCYVHTAKCQYHPTYQTEYADKNGFRLWPITPEDFERAGFPIDFGLLAPVKSEAASE